MEKQIADLNVSGIDKEKISKSIKHKKGMYLTKSFFKALIFLLSLYGLCFYESKHESCQSIKAMQRSDKLSLSLQYNLKCNWV